MLSRAFDHIFMEKARYKFLIIIIIISNGMLTFAFFVKPHWQVQGFPREFSSDKLMHFTNIVSSKLLNQRQYSGAANNKFCKALWLE